jgi:hypothetical protein
MSCVFGITKRGGKMTIWYREGSSYELKQDRWYMFRQRLRHPFRRKPKHFARAYETLNTPEFQRAMRDGKIKVVSDVGITNKEQNK